MADDQTTQPTVLVKKADGTTERVPLDSFRKQKKEIKLEEKLVEMKQEEVPAFEEKLPEPVETSPRIDPPTPVVKSIVEPKVVKEPEPILKEKEKEKVNPPESKPLPKKTLRPSYILLSDDPKKEESKKDSGEEKGGIFLPQKETPHELSTTTPVKNIFVDEAEASLEWDKDDHVSLLEEDMPEVEDLKQRGAVHETHGDIATGVSSQDGVSKELQPRLVSLVVSFRKGIRNDNQFLDYAIRNVEQGGLGMAEIEAKELLESTKKENKPATEQKPIVLPRLIDFPIATPKMQEQKSPVKNIQPLSNPVPRPRNIPKAPSPLLKHDIVSSKEVSRIQGPEDEAQNFTLVDLRRLSRDPAVAVDMLLTKFEGWKEESFLLYMKTRDAWHLSPLNNKYTSTTSQALREGVTVQDVLDQDASPERMTIEEYNNIVLFNKNLDV
ncbi:hypothetical protein HOF40_04770 [Candidatus Parcubacteria bacterium]|jgi:hypothetical protein|nr:hypothetical protein [Candidatus Parcubacteria bacterium]MBT3949376.1 hypothetical protein [Candidatus Parcubacteria bacterium]